MAEVRDWTSMRVMYERLLLERTGEGVDVWNARVREQGLDEEQALRAWLAAQGVTGYPQALLVMERFGYPDFLVTSADDLIAAQYADRTHLRPVFDAIVDAAATLGEVVVQARKTYVSLVSPRRTFVRVIPARNRIDLALRLNAPPPEGRLVASKLHEQMPVHVSLAKVEDVDEEVLGWLAAAYEENR